MLHKTAVKIEFFQTETRLGLGANLGGFPGWRIKEKRLTIITKNFLIALTKT